MPSKIVENVWKTCGKLFWLRKTVVEMWKTFVENLWKCGKLVESLWRKCGKLVQVFNNVENLWKVCGKLGSKIGFFLRRNFLNLQLFGAFGEIWTGEIKNLIFAKFATFWGVSNFWIFPAPG